MFHMYVFQKAMAKFSLTKNQGEPAKYAAILNFKPSQWVAHMW